MKNFDFHSAFTAICILAIIAVIVFTIYPAITGVSELGFGVQLVTAGLLFFAAMQYFLQRSSHKFQVKVHKENKQLQDEQHAFEMGLQQEKQEFERKVQNANYKFSLFEKRSEIYLTTVKLVEEMVRNSDSASASDKVEKFVWILERDRYLLPKDAVDYTAEVCAKVLLHNKALKLIEEYEELEQFQGGITDIESKILSQSRSDSTDLIEWFKEDHKNGKPREIFKPLLELPDDLEP